MRRAVVLLSGGLDSTTTLAVANAEGYETYALSFDYGQRHSIELELARETAHALGAKKHLVIDFNLRNIGGSALTSAVDVPKRDPGEIQETQENAEIPVTYVPARNTIFLSFALAWSETLKAENIFIGANAVDYSGYPDCRPEFIRAFEDMANLATKVSVEGKVHFTIHAPLIHLSKADIIRKGTDLKVDYSRTWSCYDPQLKAGMHRPCMHCDSCLLRAKGFRDAGIADPLLLKR